VIETEGGPVYFGGDTAFGSHFAESGERFGPFRFALLPIGAYRPRWFMGEVHVDPEEAVRAHRDLRSSLSLGIHHGTFQLTAEGREEPVTELGAELRAQGVDDSAFIVLRPGESRVIPSLRRERLAEGR
jgi:L-ascorbate metabolism protein UlaG (beta-lactamase superfamily)